MVKSPAAATEFLIRGPLTNVPSRADCGNPKELPESYNAAVQPRGSGAKSGFGNL